MILAFMTYMVENFLPTQLFCLLCPKVFIYTRGKKSSNNDVIR